MFTKLKIMLEMIKFEHTVFALPFAYLGALLGGVVVLDRLPSWSEIGWITLAMVGARSAAMALNRVIDRWIDAKNPRTAGRALPAGLLSAAETYVFIISSFLLLFFAAFQLNGLAVQLLPVAVFVLVFYSYTKRFTWGCHLVLGIAIGLAPLGGWVAVTGRIDWIAITLFITASLWTAGFDIIYACQDIEFDKKLGLYSIPSRFGIKRALHISKFIHVATSLGLFVLFGLAELGWWYLMGGILASLILYYEHRLVKPNDLSKLNTAFFTMNGVLSVIVFVFTLIDVVVK
jgi:4-hydroxybenzoate polyprenyltransferase